MKWNPHYVISPVIANCLMRIEAARASIAPMSLTASVLTAMRAVTRLLSTHFSTKIEGNHSLPTVGAYYSALNRGPSHNYYEGRAEADITPWLEYFVEGMAVVCENIFKRTFWI